MAQSADDKEMEGYWRRVFPGGEKGAPSSSPPPAPAPVTSVQVVETSSEEGNLEEIQETLEAMNWNMAEMMKQMAKQQEQISAQKELLRPHGCNRCLGRSNCHCDQGDIILVSQNQRVATPVQMVSPVALSPARPASPVVRIASPMLVAGGGGCCCRGGGVQQVVQPQQPAPHPPQPPRPIIKETPKQVSFAECPVHDCTCSRVRSPEPSNEAPPLPPPPPHAPAPAPIVEMPGCRVQCCQGGCRRSQQIYVLPPAAEEQEEKRPGLTEEDLPDIGAIKDRLDKLEGARPDQEQLKPILENVHDLREHLLADLEAVRERLETLSDRVTEADHSVLVDRVDKVERSVVLILEEMRGLNSHPDLLPRLRDIQDTHSFIKSELAKIAVRIESLNNIDTLVSLQGERVGEAEDMLRQHCEDENTARNQFTRKLQDIENALRNLDKHKSDNERRNDRLSEKLDELFRSIQEQNIRVEKLSSVTTTGMRDFEKQLERLGPQLDRQKELIDNLKGDRDRHQDDMRGLRDKLGDLEDALRRLNDMGPGRGGGGGGGGGPVITEEVVVDEVTTTQSAMGGGGGKGEREATGF